MRDTRIYASYGLPGEFIRRIAWPIVYILEADSYQSPAWAKYAERITEQRTKVGG
jgi:hypothetical protein